MPRWGQMSRNAKTRPSRPRPMSSGSPSSVLCTSRPRRTSAPTSATYHSPRRSSALRSCMVSSPGGRRPGRSLHRHERQIGIAGFAARLRQHAMHLAAMVRLMVEHMRDQEPFRLAQFPLDGAGVIGEFARKRRGVEPVRPVDDHYIESLALALQLVPVAMERHGFGNAAVGAGRAGKPAHPDAIGPQQVVEGGVDRAEERPAITSPLGVGEHVGGAIKVLVLPAVITRHALHIAEIDHRLICGTDGEGQMKKGTSSASSILRPLNPHAAIAALAFSTIAAKAAGSRIARSDSTLRSTNSPALPRPPMNRL